MNTEIAHLKKIAELLSQGRAAVLVGAGFSKNAISLNGDDRMPSWEELHQVLFDKLFSSEEDREKYRNISTPKLARSFEFLFKRPDLERVLKQTIKDGSFIPSKLHRQLLLLPWSNILTTNYDTLLERAADQNFQENISEQFQVISTEKDLLGSSGQKRIIKLHGSFPSNPPYIVTSEDYRTYKNKFREFVSFFKQCFIENTVCLIGFSGRDPNFEDWLGDILDYYGRESYQNIYMFCLREPDSLEKAFLNDKNIVPLVLEKAFPDVENSAEKLFSKLFSYLSTESKNCSCLSREKPSCETIETYSTLKIIESWASDDKKLHFKRYGDGSCEQGGEANFKDGKSCICFPVLFAEPDYTFLYDPPNLSIEILERNVTGVILQLRSNQPVKTIRWTAKGFC